jgi:Domain of unknown function (DUF4136)
MHKTVLAVVTSGLALGVLGCSPSIHVRTIVAPQARISTLHAFRLLPVPRRRDGVTSTNAYDPMVANSITNLALRETIWKALRERGYMPDEIHPDFAVAVYASAREKLDVTEWDYGYPYWPRWRHGYPFQERITTYTEGTVVVDVLDAQSRELLWRGDGNTVLTDSPSENTKRLQEVAAAIVKKFPKETPRAVAATR